MIVYRHLEGNPVAEPDAGNDDCKRDFKMGLEVVGTGAAIISTGYTLATLLGTGAAGATCCAALMCRIG